MWCIINLEFAIRNANVYVRKRYKYGIEFKNNNKNNAINERLIWKGIALTFYISIDFWGSTFQNLLLIRSLIL